MFSHLSFVSYFSPTVECQRWISALREGIFALHASHHHKHSQSSKQARLRQVNEGPQSLDRHPPAKTRSPRPPLRPQKKLKDPIVQDSATPDGGVPIPGFSFPVQRSGTPDGRSSRSSTPRTPTMLRRESSSSTPTITDLSPLTPTRHAEYRTTSSPASILPPLARGSNMGDRLKNHTPLNYSPTAQFQPQYIPTYQVRSKRSGLNEEIEWNNQNQEISRMKRLIELTEELTEEIPEEISVGARWPHCRTIFWASPWKYQPIV